MFTYVAYNRRIRFSFVDTVRFLEEGSVVRGFFLKYSYSRTSRIYFFG